MHLSSMADFQFIFAEPNKDDFIIGGIPSFLSVWAELLQTVIGRAWNVGGGFCVGGVWQNK